MKKRKKRRKKPHKALDTLSKRASHKQRNAHRKQSQTSIASLSEIGLGLGFTGMLPAVPSQIAEDQRSKKGRRTVADNFLLGSRDQWLRFFEECWPEIGWQLLQIRKAGHCEIEDIQTIFQAVEKNSHYHHAKAFLRGFPERVVGEELRANRIRASKLHEEIRELKALRGELYGSYPMAQMAMEQAEEQPNEIIEKELGRGTDGLVHVEMNLSCAEKESTELDNAVLNQETYWYCSQLADFLYGKKRYAVEPLRLANALAGLPEMGWRESLARCSKMARCSVAQFPYRAFEVIERLWHRRPRNLRRPPTEYFGDQILKMPKKDDGIRDTLCRTWRDLQLALERCWTEQHSEEFMPYAVTSAYIQNRFRDKTPADYILDKHAMLLKELG